MAAMIAQRIGLHPIDYVTTRTSRDLVRDVRAAVQTWAWPVRTLLGSFGLGGESADGGDGENKAAAPKRTKLNGMPSWFSPKKGFKYNSFDLDVEDDTDYAVTMRSLRKTWAGYSEVSGGGHGLSGKSIESLF